jgi:hypothetical protein
MPTGRLGTQDLTTTDNTTVYTVPTNTFSVVTLSICNRGNSAVALRVAVAAAAPVAQTLCVQDVVAGTANTAGSNFTIKGSASTGSAAGGSILFQVTPAGGAGSTQNAFDTALTIGSTRLVTFAAGITVTTNGRFQGDRTTIGFANNGICIGSDSFLGFNSAGTATSAPNSLVYGVGAAVVGVRAANTTTGGALNFLEQTAPSAPAANQVVIYAVDNGGKTELMALFPTGAAQQIAIEP